MSELRVDDIEVKKLNNLAGNNLIDVNTDGSLAFNAPIEGVNQGLQTWTTATRPASPTTGSIGINQTLGYTEIYNGNFWQPINEKGVVQKGLILHLDSADPESYTEGSSTFSDLSRLGLGFTGNSSRISSTIGLTSGSNWNSRANSQEAPLDNDYHSLFFTIRFVGTSTFPEAYTGSWNKIFEHVGGAAGGERSPGIWRWPSERRIHWRYNPGNTGIDFGKNSAGNQFDLNTWYHIGQTKTGALIRAYVNGVEVASGNVAFPKEGGNSDINLMPGYPADILNLNDVMLYNRPITQTEVTQNFNIIRNKYGI